MVDKVLVYCKIFLEKNYLNSSLYMKDKKKFEKKNINGDAYIILENCLLLLFFLLFSPSNQGACSCMTSNMRSNRNYHIGNSSCIDR